MEGAVRVDLVLVDVDRLDGIGGHMGDPALAVVDEIEGIDSDLNDITRADGGDFKRIDNHKSDFKLADGETIAPFSGNKSPITCNNSHIRGQGRGEPRPSRARGSRTLAGRGNGHYFLWNPLTTQNRR